MHERTCAATSRKTDPKLVKLFTDEKKCCLYDSNFSAEIEPKK